MTKIPPVAATTPSLKFSVALIRPLLYAASKTKSGYMYSGFGIFRQMNLNNVSCLVLASGGSDLG